MATGRNPSQAKYSEQNILNSSYDADYDILALEGVSFDGTNLVRNISKDTNLKITQSGNYTYIAKAPVGTSQATAKWQVYRLDVTSGLIKLWADGNADFDNIATDLTSLSYS